MNHAAFDPSGRRFATAVPTGPRGSGTPPTGEPVTPPLGPSSASVIRVAFNPDGRLARDRRARRQAQVWDAAGGRSVTYTLCTTATVRDVRFSPDGTRLATASADGRARIWDVATGQTAVPPLEHRQEVLGLAFSPDGRRLATAAADGTARVWDAATGAAALPPIEHTVPGRLRRVQARRPRAPDRLLRSRLRRAPGASSGT